MKPTDHFPNGKAFALTRVALILFASAFLASCVTPKPPKSEMMALKENPANVPCAKQIINTGKKPRRTNDSPAWEPCVNYQPGSVRSLQGTVGKSEDVLLVAALSGGGKRSAAFAYGVFDTLNTATINLADESRKYTPRRLLEEIDLISAVSGGAMTASYYALHRKNTFLPKEVSCGYESFLYEDTGAKLWGMYLFPWKWGWMVDSSYGSNDVMAKFFSERLFGMPAAEPETGEFDEREDLSAYCAKPSADRPNGAIYADLYDQGPPFLLLASTDLTRGLTFPYSQDGFDMVCADVSEFPLAWALAGTNAFPVLLSTVNLKNNHAGNKEEKPCSPVRNRELSQIFNRHIGCVPLETILDEQSEPTVGANNQFFRSNTLLKTAMTCYARPGDAAHVHLADGGMTDNFGLKGITDWFHTHRGTSSFWYLVHTTKRAQLLIIDGQRDVDPKIAKSEQGPDVLDAVGTMISNSVDQSNISSFAETRDLFDVLTTFLAMRDFVIFDEWQKESYGKLYNAEDAEQFSKFLDGIENSSATDPEIGRVNEQFESRFDKYIADVRKWYAGHPADFRTTNEPAGTDRWAKFSPISRGIDIIQIAELYGAPGSRIDWTAEGNRKVLGDVLHGDGKARPASITEFLTADVLLRRKLERIKDFHARKVESTRDGKAVVSLIPRYWADISKVSVVDDCNSNRRKLLMSSDTGMGLDPNEIAAAIEAGKDVAKRHLDSILTFLNTGHRLEPASCEKWMGSKPASVGGATADPVGKPNN